MIQLNIEKRDLLILSVVLVFILGAGFAIAVWNTADHPMSHGSADVKVTIAGADYSLQEAIDTGLLVTQYKFVQGTAYGHNWGNCALTEPKPSCGADWRELANFCEGGDADWYRWLVLCGK